MCVPALPLADLYEGCKTAIERKGGEVILRAPVRELRIENDALAAVQFDAGRQETADAYVFAVPHTVFAELLPADVKQKSAFFQNLANLKYDPITGVHFCFDREVMKEP